jgi:hypothetical protein
MGEQEQLRSVIRSHETHSINEYEILERLRRGMTFQGLESRDGYCRLLAARGCTMLACDDLGTW